MYQRQLDEGELIQKNIGLVHKIVNEMHRGREMYDDLVQEGIIGLITAIRRFDPEKGFTFSTFAYHYIKGYIIRSLNNFELGRPVRIPVYVWDRKKLNDHNFTAVSYDALLTEDEKAGELIEILLVDERSYEDESERIDTLELMKELAGCLNLREAYILQKVYVEGFTFEKVASILGVTRQRVKQIEIRAIQKIRKKYRCREALKRCLNT